MSPEQARADRGPARGHLGVRLRPVRDADRPRGVRGRRRRPRRSRRSSKGTPTECVAWVDASRNSPSRSPLSGTFAAYPPATHRGCPGRHRGRSIPADRPSAPERAVSKPASRSRAHALDGGVDCTGGALVRLARGSVIARRPGSAGRCPIRFDVQRVQDAPVGVATRHLALSPDGTRLAYATTSSLRLRAMGGEDVPLPVVGGDPFFSPDSQWLAFFSSEGLQRVRVDGGTLEQITRAFGTERTLGGTWGPDDTIVLSLGGRLLRVSAKGGTPEAIAERDPSRRECGTRGRSSCPAGDRCSLPSSVRAEPPTHESL